MATIKIKASPETGGKFVPYGKVPSVPIQNAQAPVGKALANLVQAFAQAQVTGFAADETKWDVEFIRLKQDIEHAARELARKTPADGKAYSETVGKLFLERAEAFLNQIPPQLRGKYAKALANYQLNLEQRTYALETGLHDEAVKRSFLDLVQAKENEVVADPNKTKAALKEAIASIDKMPVPASVREQWKRAVKEQIETASLRSSASGAYADIWLDRLHKIEGTGKNPWSSAKGHFQFVEDTWMDMVRKYAPKVYADFDKETVLKMRESYAFARKMARAYLNEIILHFSRNGIPVNGTTVRLGWFLGPSGAAQLLAKPKDTPLGQALPKKVIDANKFLLKYKTVGGMINWARRQMGDTADPYPNVPAATKVALLQQQNAQWTALAQADANYVSAQINDAFDAIKAKLKGMPVGEAISELNGLLSSGTLDKVVARKVESLLEDLKKKYWEEQERSLVLKAWDGKDIESDLDRLIELGAPLSVIRSIRKAAKEDADKEFPELSKWKVQIALGSVDESMISNISKELVSATNPKKRDALIRLLNKAKGALKQAKREEAAMLFRRAGELTDEDMEALKQSLSPEDFKLVRAERDRILKARAKLTEEEREKLLEDRLRLLEQGKRTYEDVHSELVKLGFEDTVAFRAKLRKAYSVFEKSQEGLQQIGVLQAKIKHGMPLDPDADKDALEKWYQSIGGPKAIQLGDVNWVNTHLVPLAKMGAIPPEAADHIGGLILSDNPEAFRAGLQMLSIIGAEAPQVLNRQFGKDVLKEWQVAGTLMRYGMSPDTIFDRISAIRKAKSDGSIMQMKKQAEEELGSVDIETVIKSIAGGELDPNIAAGQNGPLLLRDYKELFKLYYPYFGNAEQTNEAVAETMARIWGEWDSKHNQPGSLYGNETRFMLLPPNKVYSPGPDGTFKWIDDWLDGILKQHKDLDGERVVLLADRQSLNEWYWRKPVTYKGYIVSKSGYVFPLEGRLKPPAQPLKEAAKQAMSRAVRKRKAVEAAMWLSPLNLFGGLTGVLQPNAEMQKWFEELENERRKVSEK